MSNGTKWLENNPSFCLKFNTVVPVFDCIFTAEKLTCSLCELLYIHARASTSVVLVLASNDRPPDHTLARILPITAHV